MKYICLTKYVGLLYLNLDLQDIQLDALSPLNLLDSQRELRIIGIPSIT